jgi:amidohydrolase
MKISRRRAIQVIAQTGIAVPASILTPASAIAEKTTLSNENKMLKDLFTKCSNELFPETKNNREHLHRWPELSHREHKTAVWIAEKLRSYGITELETGELGIGVLAIIRGKKPGKGGVVALRADIDALKIDEDKNLPYCSMENNRMHACGHDYHSSCLISAAKILHDTRNKWHGVIKVLFQRGEEAAHPELKKNGAVLALENGLLAEPRPTAILGQHVSPELPFGKVAFFRTGEIGSMAAADTFGLEVLGTGGHGGRPHRGIDPVPVAAQIILALQSISSRRADPNSPCVLSVGELITEGGSANVLATKVSMRGTLRTFETAFRERIQGEIKTMIESIAAANQTSASIEFIRNTIPLSNDPQLNDRTRQAAIQFLGPENVLEAERRTGGEDFSFYGTVPGLAACFWRIGTGDPQTGRFSSDLHTNTFDVHPESMRLAPGLLAWLAACELGN